MWFCVSSCRIVYNSTVSYCYILFHITSYHIIAACRVVWSNCVGPCLISSYQGEGCTVSYHILSYHNVLHITVTCFVVSCNRIIKYIIVADRLIYCVMDHRYPIESYCVYRTSLISYIIWSYCTCRVTHITRRFHCLSAWQNIYLPVSNVNASALPLQTSAVFTSIGLRCGRKNQNACRAPSGLEWTWSMSGLNKSQTLKLLLCTKKKRSHEVKQKSVFFWTQLCQSQIVTFILRRAFVRKVKEFDSGHKIKIKQEGD